MSDSRLSQDAYRQLLIVRQSSLKIAAELIINGKEADLDKVLEIADLITDSVIASRAEKASEKNNEQ